MKEGHKSHTSDINTSDINKENLRIAMSLGFVQIIIIPGK